MTRWAEAAHSRRHACRRMPAPRARQRDPPPSRPHSTVPSDPFGARAALSTPDGVHQIHRLDRLAARLNVRIDRLPFSIRILLESVLRNVDGFQVTTDDVQRLARWRES